MSLKKGIASYVTAAALSSAVAVVVHGSANAADGPRDVRGRYTEERVICGEPQSTPELHENVCWSGCKCPRDGKWCFKETPLTVRTPNSKWIFVGSAIPHCVKENQGSCAWNTLGSADLFTVTMDNPTEKRAIVTTGSRSIAVDLCALARFYP